MVDTHNPTAGLPRVSVIIVNYETSAMVKRCAASLRGQPVTHEVIVVDNPSPANDADNLEGLGVRVIRNRENIGYGRACNAGAVAARGGLICVLNPDTALPEGALGAWASLMETELAAGRRIGLLAPRLLNDNGAAQRSAYQFVNPLNYWLYHSIAAGALKALRKSFRLPSPESRRGVRSAGWVMGAALMIQRDAWDAVRGFGENYFLYAEDTDLCWRLREAGWDVCYTGDVSIIHTQGDPPPERRALSIARLFDGINTFISQHYGAPRRAAVRACVITDMILRIALYSMMRLRRPGDKLLESRLEGAKRVLRNYRRRQ
ncbi:MAG: glycosyltransferase family 2 protein [Candidatus Sumerlaeota bacterium]|nr:glycosyltransferase family 2 protein [Candidatus Sumerlaeota bacterium]